MILKRIAQQILVAFCFFAWLNSAFPILCTGENASSDSSWLDVPVYFVGDRKSLGYKDRYSAMGQDQLVGSQHIRFGIVHIAVKPDQEQLQALKPLIDFGCKPISRKEAESGFYKDLETQMRGHAPGITVNYNANDGEVSIWNLPWTRSWMKTVKETKNLSKSKSIPIYIHGCCISQKTAFQQAASLSLALKSPVVLFDWATVGTNDAPFLPEVNSYRRSERALEISEVNFRNFVESFSKEIDPSEFDFIAHSMGNRLLISMLRQADQRTKFHSLHFVRPDLSFQAFVLDERRLVARTDRSYVYCSSNDPWLSKSQLLSAGVPRLGKPGKLSKLLVVEGWNYGPPMFSTFLDVSSLRLKHAIPMELIAELMEEGVSKTSKQFRYSKLSMHEERFLTVEPVSCSLTSK